MVYTRKCRLCLRLWTFHDDDTEEPLLCDDCHGIWQEHILVQKIMAGEYVLTDNPLKQEPET